MKLRQGVGIPPLFMLVERKVLVFNPIEASLGLRIEDIEVLVSRLFLAEFHLLDISDEQLNLVIGEVADRVEIFLSLVIVHGCYLDEGKVVECLSLTCGIILREAQCTVGINTGGVKVAVVVIVRLLIEAVHNRVLTLRTTDEE
jgi:hypothetical protein